MINPAIAQARNEIRLLEKGIKIVESLPELAVTSVSVFPEAVTLFAGSMEDFNAACSTLEKLGHKQGETKQYFSRIYVHYNNGDNPPIVLSIDASKVKFVVSLEAA